MKLKLTRSEFDALYSLLQHMIIAAKPHSLDAKLLHAVLLDVFKKLYKQAIDVKRRYPITLSDAEALAFYLFFQHSPLPEEAVFEINLIRTINNSIHKQYAKP